MNGEFLEATAGVRSGSWTFEQVLQHAQGLFKNVGDAVMKSPLRRR
jgi:hypothetical protein